LMSKKKMLEEKITRNPKFLLVGISLGSSTWRKENKLVEMRERVQVDVPLSNMGQNLFIEWR
jgi:hypothetical protein